MKLNSTQPKRTSGFTLIELLVVIAIIAILAAILFPVFARARENARRSSCQSNLKQIGLGILQYTQDYDEKFFAQRASGVPGGGAWDTIQPYMKSVQIFQCPSEPFAPNNNPNACPASYGCGGGFGETGYADYFLNSGLTTDGLQGRSQADLTQPSVSIMAGDNGTYNAANYRPYNNGYMCSGIIAGGTTANCGTEALDQIPANRHLETANYLFCDGHVKTEKTTQLWGNSTAFTTSQNGATFHTNGT